MSLPGVGQANLERGDFTNPSQLESPYGLAAAGAVAVPALVEALQDRRLVAARRGGHDFGLYGCRGSGGSNGP